VAGVGESASQAPPSSGLHLVLYWSPITLFTQLGRCVLFEQRLPALGIQTSTDARLFLFSNGNTHESVLHSD
jgi:hypothetical protein